MKKALFHVLALISLAAGAQTVQDGDSVIRGDGTLTKMQSEPFGFRLEKNILVPQKGGSPLGDGTLEFELEGSVWTEACKLRRNPYSENYQFEGDNGLYAFEYINGQMLISNHKHHDFFEVVAAQCREL